MVSQMRDAVYMAATARLQPLLVLACGAAVKLALSPQCEVASEHEVLPAPGAAILKPAPIGWGRHFPAAPLEARVQICKLAAFEPHYLPPRVERNTTEAPNASTLRFLRHRRFRSGSRGQFTRRSAVSLQAHMRQPQRASQRAIYQELTAVSSILSCWGALCRVEQLSGPRVRRGVHTCAHASTCR